MLNFIESNSVLLIGLALFFITLVSLVNSIRAKDEQARLKELNISLGNELEWREREMVAKPSYQKVVISKDEIANKLERNFPHHYVGSKKNSTVPVRLSSNAKEAIIRRFTDSFQDLLEEKNKQNIEEFTY